MSHFHFSDKEKIQFVIVAVLFGAIVLPGVFKKDEKVVVETQAPSFFVSSESVEQGDIFFVGVKGSDIAGGRFADHELSFFDVAPGAIAAIVAADVKEMAGDKSVTLWSGESAFSKNVSVLERMFPVTKIVVTKELETAGYTPEIITKNLTEEEKPTIGEVVSKFTDRAYFSGPFIYPLSEIVVEGAFGNIRQEGSSAFQHLGVDLKADVGTPVYAIGSGAVVLADTLPTYGNTVVIDHGLGIFSLYLHLNEFLVLENDFVEKGTVIAKSGNTGYSVSPHLHFSVKVDGASVDPLRFINTVKEIFTPS